MKFIKYKVLMDGFNGAKKGDIVECSEHLKGDIIRYGYAEVYNEPIPEKEPEIKETKEEKPKKDTKKPKQK